MMSTRDLDLSMNEEEGIVVVLLAVVAHQREEEEEEEGLEGGGERVLIAAHPSSHASFLCSVYVAVPYWARKPFLKGGLKGKHSTVDQKARKSSAHV